MKQGSTQGSVYIEHCTNDTDSVLQSSRVFNGKQFFFWSDSDQGIHLKKRSNHCGTDKLRPSIALQNAVDASLWLTYENVSSVHRVDRAVQSLNSEALSHTH